MRLVRWAVIAAVAVVVCGAAWLYRDLEAAKLGFGVPASAADNLLTKGAGTVVTRDTNVTNQKALEAQLESDEAMRQNILTQISYTEIRAPVSGRIGSIPNKAGTTLRVADNTATAVLAAITQVAPLYVRF